MKVSPIKTHRIQTTESLTAILDRYIPSLNEETIIAITSKVISLCQGRIVSKGSVNNKFELVKQEADTHLKKEDNLYEAYLTIKNHILIPSAGIDESNGNGVYILYPCHIQKTAAEIWGYLRHKHNLNNLGVIITDSHTTPLRKGVTGIALGWRGFKPLHSYIGEPDIFEHPLRVTQINIIDALAASAVFIMGEGAEQTPLALIENAPKVCFLSRPPTVEEEKMVHIALEKDIYAPLLKGVEWVWKKT